MSTRSWTLVSEDMSAAIARLATDKPGPAIPALDDWHAATVVTDRRRGYLQEIDSEGLAAWAAQNGTAMKLLVRPGDYVFPGAPIALLTGDAEGAEQAIRARTALGGARVSSLDIEFALRQLVEVAVRALSPGINDPHTAISVLDRLGAALCDIVPLYLPSGVHRVEGRTVLVMPAVEYGGLVDGMFHMIRQNASGSAAVLIRMLEVLSAVAACEHQESRVGALRRHADLIMEDAGRTIANSGDLEDIRQRRMFFDRVTRDSACRPRSAACYC